MQDAVLRASRDSSVPSTAYPLFATMDALVRIHVFLGRYGVAGADPNSSKREPWEGAFALAYDLIAQLGLYLHQGLGQIMWSAGEIASLLF